MGTDEYITVTDAGKRYGHKGPWWYKRIADGDLKPYKSGRDKRATFLKVSEIENYLKLRPATDDDGKEK